MNTFAALSDPTRQRIVEILASSGRLSASDISSKFSITAPAISQHLKVLKQANLVKVEVRAQHRIYQVNPVAMEELEDWACKMRQFWNERFDALEELLAEEMKELKPKKGKNNGRKKPGK